MTRMITCLMKMKIKLLLVLSLFLTAVKVTACECPTNLPPLSAEEIKSYGLIFTGKIDSVRPEGSHCKAWFTGQTLYKGVELKQIVVRYDCQTTCKMEFVPGDQWLIYATKSDHQWIVDYCGRSRIHPGSGNDENFTVYANLTYDEEIGYLEKYVPKKDFLSLEDNQKITENTKVLEQTREMNHPQGWNILVLLGISLAGTVVIYLLVKKFWK